jgi:A/G-specific adenine glycosylase
MAARRAAAGPKAPKAVAPRALPFAPRLIAWQKKHGRHDLPWQRTRDAYRIWLSEIMLQQTQVATVIPYYERFLAEFADVNALAAAPVDRVLELWSGLGYYRRAHHLHEAACAIVTRHGGRFPRDAEAIAALPGVGRSTAAAIAALAFGQRSAILEGNVKRVLARHRGVDGYPGAPKVQAKLWSIAESLLPSRQVGVYTQALMDLGATVCTRSAPRCGACPVAADCVASRSDRVALFPSPRPAKERPKRAVRVLLMEHAGTMLLEKRPALGVWAGLWSLPELDPAADVARHCKARYAASVVVGDELEPIEHGFTHCQLTLHPQRVTVRTWPSRAEAPGLLWLTREDALAAALPAPIRKLLKQI